VVDGCQDHSNDPGALQMDWLEVQLMEYRERGMQVWLTGHVPPHMGHYFDNCCKLGRSHVPGADFQTCDTVISPCDTKTLSSGISTVTCKPTRSLRGTTDEQERRPFLLYRRTRARVDLETHVDRKHT
jgi:hypothetical protein